MITPKSISIYGLLNAAFGGATLASKAKNRLSNNLYYFCDRLLVSLFSQGSGLLKADLTV